MEWVKLVKLVERTKVVKSYPELTGAVGAVCPPPHHAIGKDGGGAKGSEVPVGSEGGKDGAAGEGGAKAELVGTIVIFLLKPITHKRSLGKVVKEMK